jgi:hypothetical protein
MTAVATETRVWERVNPDQFANDSIARRLRLRALRPVGLETLIEHAALMQRVDRKYVAPVDAVRDLVNTVRGTHHVLSIDGRRYTTYRTLYFDTDNFTSARDHIQDRRRRWKVRTRLYVEDELHRVEVKTKDNRGNTVKVMGVSHTDHYGVLVGSDRDFVASYLSDFPQIDVRDLVPAAEVRYKRATLTDLAAGTRVTIDWGLSMHMNSGDVWLDDRFAMVETKGPLVLSGVDKALHELGVRPRRFSKYVAAASTLTDGIPANGFASLRAGGILHSRPMAV